MVPHGHVMGNNSSRINNQENNTQHKHKGQGPHKKQKKRRGVRGKKKKKKKRQRENNVLFRKEGSQKVYIRFKEGVKQVVDTV